MNFKYLIFLCLMFIVSIGAVSAADDVNNTVDNTVDADTAINSVSVDSVIMDSPIYANNAKEYTITNDNYENYFDNETGDILDTAPFNNGDVLKIDNVSDKCFVISKNLTILPAGANTTFTNVGFNFVPGSEGSIVNGVTINNTVGKWSNNDAVFLIPILIQHTKNITVINSNLYSSASTVPAPNNVVYMVNASYCNIRNNTISQSSGKVPVNIVSSSYNNITDNKMYSKSANVIFVGLGFSSLAVAGVSEGNLFKNNILDGNGISSAMCYAIKLQGNSNVGKTIGQNTFIGNTISNAYDGIYIQDDVNGTTIINNTFINVRTGIEMVHQRAVVEKAYIYGNNITATTDAIVITRGSATIEDNVINAGNRGIFLKPFSSDLLILNNHVVARGQYAVWSDSRSNNVTVMGNYLVSSSFKGDNAVKAKDKSKVSGNGPLDINVAIDADITKNATATIKLSPMVNGTITISFNGKIETIDFNGSGSLVYDLGLLEFGEHNITVTYNGNNNFNGTTVTKTFFVDKINTGIKLVVGNVNVDETAVINVTLTPGINGTVKVVVNGQTYNVVIKNGIGTLEVKWLKAGKYDVSAYFTGQNYYKDSFASASFSVNKLNPVLSINASSINCGEDVIINVSSSVSSIEVELVIRLDNSNYYRYDSFYIYGQESRKISDLPAGSYLVQFIAPEDTKNNRAQTTVRFTVSKLASSVAVDVKDIVVGEDAVIGVSVPGIVSGVVNVTVNDESYDVAIVDGKGTLTISNLVAGDYNISASYLGDDKYLSSSNSTKFTISKLASSVAVDVDDIVVGEDAVIGVSVPGIVSGVVNVTVNGRSYNVAIVDGKGVLIISNLAAGDYAVDVNYAGDNKYVASSNSTKFTISKLASSVAVDVGDIVVGEDAVVNVVLPDDATGSVTITVNGKDYVVDVKYGVANIAISDLAKGNYNVSVKYSGDGKYLPSENATHFDVVKASEYNVTIIIDVGDIVVGEDAVIGVSVPDIVSGVVNVTVNGRSYNVAIVDGKGVLIISNLAAGNYNVNVNYAGDNKYLPSSNSANFTVSKVSSSVIVDVGDIVVGEDAVIGVSVPDIVSGVVNVTVNGRSYNVAIVDGKGVLTISNLAAGDYDVNVNYAGDNKYVASSNSTKFTISKLASSVLVNVKDIVVGEDAVVNVVLPDDANGNVTITVNGKNYVAVVKYGVASVTISDLAKGNYNVSVKYSGDNKYLPGENTTQFSVAKVSDYNVTVDIVDIIEGENATVTVVVPDDGTGEVIITIDGKEYKGSVDNGVAKVVIPDLKEGTYKVVTFYTGDNKYDSMIVNGTITVNKNTKTTLTMDDVVKYFKGAQNLTAKLVDAFGNPIANATVYFTVNGKVYAKTTDKNGTASMGIGLVPNEYKVNAVFNGTKDYDKATANATVTVKNTVLGNDTTLYFCNGTKYVAKFLDSNGKALANTTVKFNINGVFYTRVTDENGTASLTIKLDPKSYVITAYNPATGEERANNITVMPTLITKDLSMKFQDGSKFNVTILDGQGKPLANQNVTFNVNGVFYNKVSGADGVASLNINLNAGKYIITSMWNGYQVGNNITIA
ncbi:Ig-like domain repeat protein [Methanobrevibacter smithii]|uniref:Ig-like domain repeat protein n=1 Tax=Methanobrevibacter smithii TaxID=2173 RepID=UPI00036F008A|nr:Ig-like domain repeat protein [Methanobrevibacter smithii]